MPIPIILGGIALAAAAGYGAKKGYDAIGDKKIANNINNEAKNIFDNAKNELTKLKEETNIDLKKLGNLKMSIYQETLVDFIDIFSEIKNIDFENNLDIGTDLNIDYGTILRIKDSVIEIKEMVGGGLAALGSGAAAGFGAFGAVGMLASASTGTAISGLSGIAATNATLAWLGGGALSVGGMGIAGGTAVLGGIVAAPVLAVGGFILATKAEEAKNNAYANLEKARAEVAQMNIAKISLRDLRANVQFTELILYSLNNIFNTYIGKMESIVDFSNDYSKYSIENKKIIMTTASIAQTIKNICDTPIIDEDGNVTRKIKRVLEKANKFLIKLNEV
jgi:hypothetical protein